MAGTSGTFLVLAAALLPLAGCTAPALMSRNGVTHQAAGAAAADSVAAGAATDVAGTSAPSPRRGDEPHTAADPGATGEFEPGASTGVAAGTRSLAELIGEAELPGDVKARLLAALSVPPLAPAAEAPRAAAAGAPATAGAQRGPKPHVAEPAVTAEPPRASKAAADSLRLVSGGAAPPSPAALPDAAAAPLQQRASPPRNASEIAHASAGIVTSGGATLDWKEALSNAVASLESALEAETAADDVALALRLRLLYLAAGRREEALRPVTGLAPAEQEFWNNELYALSELVGPRTDGAQRAAVALPHHRHAALALAEMAPLRVQNLAFCREVASYGVYTRYPQDRFQPGEEVLLYAELENFQTRSTPKGWHTSFRARYQILDASGRRVAHADLPRTEEYCAHPRRDYFVCYFVTIPARIYDGQYTLELSVEDALQNELATSSIEFAVAEQRTRP